MLKDEMVKKKRKIAITIIGIVIILSALVLLGFFLKNSLSIIKPISEDAFSGYFGNVYWNDWSDSEYRGSKSSLEIGFAGESGDEKHRAWIDWDLLSIPEGSVVKKVIFHAYSYPGEGGRADSTEYYRGCASMGNSLYDTSKQQLWTTLGNCKIYKTLRGSDRLLISQGWKSLDLGEEAVTDVQNAILMGKNSWTMAIDTNFDGDFSDASSFASPSGSYKPYLDIQWATVIQVFRMGGTSCNLIDIYSDERTANDYDDYDKCMEMLESSRISVYRLESNKCFLIKIYPGERVDGFDFDTLEECEENKISLITIILIILVSIVGGVIVIGGLIYVYVKFGKNKKRR